MTQGSEGTGFNQTYQKLETRLVVKTDAPQLLFGARVRNTDLVSVALMTWFLAKTVTSVL